MFWVCHETSICHFFDVHIFEFIVSDKFLDGSVVGTDFSDFILTTESLVQRETLQLVDVAISLSKNPELKSLNNVIVTELIARN